MRLIIIIFILFQSQYSFGLIIKGKFEYYEESIGKIYKYSDQISLEGEIIEEFQLDSNGEFKIEFEIDNDKIYRIAISIENTQGSFYIENKGEYELSLNKNYIKIKTERNTNINSEFTQLDSQISKLSKKNKKLSFKSKLKRVKKLNKLRSAFDNKTDAKSLLFKYNIIFIQLLSIRNYEEFKTNSLFDEIEHILFNDEVQLQNSYYIHCMLEYYSYINLDTPKILGLKENQSSGYGFKVANFLQKKFSTHRIVHINYNKVLLQK